MRWRCCAAAIPPYNVSTGVANTPTGGYHDTITVYFVWAVDRLLSEGLDTPAILRDPLVERTALLEWWDKETLMSSAARAAWLEPTLPSNGTPDHRSIFSSNSWLSDPML